MRDIGIFHYVERTENGYLITKERLAWYEIARHVRPAFHYREGESAYCYSAVFAPATLTAPIYHRWEHYTEATGRWTTKSRVAFPIRGGRDEGFRGYTVKTELEPGMWRCSVETERGSLIGREMFLAIPTDVLPPLEVAER